MSAGSSCVVQLDPRNLPVRFSAADETADGRMRTVEIDRHRVLLRRTVRGVQMRLNLPLHAYLGVSVKLVAVEAVPCIALVLEHRDAALSVPLQIADEADTLVADWQLWGKMLGQKLLVMAENGELREPVETAGKLFAGDSTRRRPRHSALRHRRPKIFRRRNRAIRYCDAVVHRDEREIIARD